MDCGYKYKFPLGKFLLLKRNRRMNVSLSSAPLILFFFFLRNDSLKSCIMLPQLYLKSQKKGIKFVLKILCYIVFIVKLQRLHLIQEVRCNCSVHRSAHLFIIAINSHNDISRYKLEATTKSFFRCSCSVTIINITKKYL